MIVTGLAGLILCFLPILFIQNATIVLALLLVGGIFWSCININSLPMVVELARAESIGSFTGYYYFFSFAASIVSPILFGFIRDLTKDYGALFPMRRSFSSWHSFRCVLSNTAKPRSRHKPPRRLLKNKKRDTFLGACLFCAKRGRI